MKLKHLVPRVFLALAICWSGAALAQNAEVGSRISHGLSLFGDLKYPADFSHFDYVNPEAPKGGTLRLSAIGTYDSFNPFITQGTPALGSPLLYEPLLTDALDEPFSMYGQLAESVEVADDFSWSIYTLREGAHFHDGVPITAEDIVFSLDILKEKGLPLYRFYYQNIVSAEALDDRRVRFNYDQAGNRELPLITGQMVVALPKHYWEGVDANGNPRDFSRSSLERPVGSGPYRIGRYEPGRYVEYVRDENYWGKDIPVMVGQHNFDVLRYDYYRDDEVALQAFFADEYDLRTEFSARNWATAYDRPAVRDGSIIKEIIPAILPVQAQFFAPNLRLEKFSDRRVRQALELAFNFEWMNANLFYGQYERVTNFWNDSPLASSGLPTGQELEILEPYRDQLPPEVFTAEFRPSVSDGTETNRNNLFRALQLMQEAGWQLRNGALVNSASEPFTIEFLTANPTFERVIQPYIRDLERLGIRGTMRLVDPTQYVERVQDGDFDIITNAVSFTLSPGNEQREYWGSEAADQPGSRNLSGVKNPVVDALIEQIVFAPDRETLVNLTKALDRVLLWNHYVILQWTAPVRFAYWDRFHHMEELPAYHPGAGGYSAIPQLWWFKAAEQQ